MEPNLLDAVDDVVRQRLSAQIDAIPLWRKIMLCLMHYKNWRVARAYNTVVVTAWREDDPGLFDEMQKRGALKWAKVYGIQLSE